MVNCTSPASVSGAADIDGAKQSIGPRRPNRTQASRMTIVDSSSLKRWADSPTKQPSRFVMRQHRQVEQGSKHAQPERCELGKAGADVITTPKTKEASNQNYSTGPRQGAVSSSLADAPFRGRGTSRCFDTSRALRLGLAVSVEATLDAHASIKLSRGQVGIHWPRRFSR